jgi:hypothetical protein
MTLYYEGDDPDGFAAEVLDEFGIDVRAPIPIHDHNGLFGGWSPNTWENERAFWAGDLPDDLWKAGHDHDDVGC